MSHTSPVQITAENVHESETVTETVIAAVADAEGVSALELEPLAAVIDPDALNALYEDGRQDVSVEFSYHGYRVCLSGAGRVTLRDPEF